VNNTFGELEDRQTDGQIREGERLVGQQQREFWVSSFGSEK